MRRITIWLSSTAAILVLLFSYRTSTAGAGGFSVPALASGLGTTSNTGTTTPSGALASPTATGSAGTSAPKNPGTGATATPTPAKSSATTPAATTTAPKVVTGQSVDTRWGPVQVAITVSGNKITAVAIPVYPNGNNRDAEINSYALPVLVQETLSAQSANINVVSGASVTSDGYISSLQSAIDAAHL